MMPEKIRMIECNANCRYIKKLACKRTLRQVFYLSDPILPPPYIHIRLYSILFHTGGGGGGRRENQRKGYRGNSKKCWSKTNMTDSISSL